MKYIQYYIVIFLFFLFNGCASKTPHFSSIEGYDNVEQNISLYTADIQPHILASLQTYKKNYYREWHIKKPRFTRKAARWALDVFQYGNYYGENLQKKEISFFHRMKEASNFQAYGSINKKGFTLRRVDMRAFPTKRALFLDPKKAGEGYPFDYLQVSSLAGYKPIFISHYSKDKAWAFIESSFTAGWVQIEDIKRISDKDAQQWEMAQQHMIYKEHYPIYDIYHHFVLYSQIGQIIPDTQDLVIPHGIATTQPLVFNARNIEIIIKQLQKNIYGWGGMYGQRDCSSTIRDFFAPFGVWLPRNSSQQAKVGKVISLEGLDDKEKLEKIKLEAKPFQTLLYKKGHILLYVGVKEDRVIVFHNAWGIKTKKNKKEGRYIIGKALFSTLTLGENIPFVDTEFLLVHQIKSMNIITKKVN